MNPMRDDKLFINWTYDPTVNRDRADIILDMLHFIREGLRDQYGPARHHESFYVMENAVKAALFERLQSPMAKSIPKRMLAPHGDTLELVATAFLDEQRWLMKGAPIAGFHCGKITDELQQRLNAFWHPEIDEEHTSLKTAFEVAYSNAARAGTRLVLMHLIPRLLQLPDAPTGWGKIREELWIRNATFQRDLLVFGALEGGDLLKIAVRLVAQQTCYSPEGETKLSMIHFLTCDGYSPGRWMSVTEEGLAKDIKAKYEAL